MSYGADVYGVGVYGGVVDDVISHVGVGQVGIAGLSVIEQNYRAVGVGAIGLSGLSVIGQNYRAAGIGHIAISGLSLVSKSHEAVGVGQVGIAGQSSITQNYRAVGIGQAGLSGASLIEQGITLISNNWVSTHYRCHLTGSADALDDLELPISSFQTRTGSTPYRVYLSIVVPNVDAYIDDINARPSGELKITRIYNYLDGSSETFVLVECGVDTIQTNQGARSGTTGNLSGYKTLTAGTAHAIELFDPITRGVDSGRRRYRCRLDPRVRPLDTVTINGETFVVDQVICMVDTKTAAMEVQELV